MPGIPTLNKKRLGMILILTGICLTAFSLPFASEYAGDGNIFWKLIQNIISGEIVFRERSFNLIPDRDQKMYKELQEYSSIDPEFNNLSEDEMIERFYDDRYRDTMRKIEFQLKLKKKKVQVVREKIALPYRYVFLVSVLFVCTGVILVIIHIRHKKSL